MSCRAASYVIVCFVYSIIVTVSAGARILIEKKVPCHAMPCRAASCVVVCFVLYIVYSSQCTYIDREERFYTNCNRKHNYLDSYIVKKTIEFSCSKIPKR